MSPRWPPPGACRCFGRVGGGKSPRWPLEAPHPAIQAGCPRTGGQPRHMLPDSRPSRPDAPQPAAILATCPEVAGRPSPFALTPLGHVHVYRAVGPLVRSSGQWRRQTRFSLQSWPMHEGIVPRLAQEVRDDGRLKRFPLGFHSSRAADEPSADQSGAETSTRGPDGQGKPGFVTELTTPRRHRARGAALSAACSPTAGHPGRMPSRPDASPRAAIPAACSPTAGHPGRTPQPAAILATCPAAAAGPALLL